MPSPAARHSSPVALADVACMRWEHHRLQIESRAAHSHNPNTCKNTHARSQVNPDFKVITFRSERCDEAYMKSCLLK